MTYRTHKRISEGIGLLASMALFHLGVIDYGYYIVGMVVMVFSQIGGVYNDVDHHWKSVPDKSIMKRILNTAIRLTGGTHRSWQTHSIDIGVYMLIASLYLPIYLVEKGMILEQTAILSRVVCTGFTVGWLSHLYSDMLSKDGVRLICFIPFKVRIVPKKLFKIDFKTGGDWEKFVFKISRYLNIVIFVSWLLYPYRQRILEFVLKIFT